MKRIFALLLALLLLAALTGCWPLEEQYTEKPVIYLYPEAETDVTVRRGGNAPRAVVGRIGAGQVARVVEPDGTLTDERGQTYRYLYWEGVDNVQYDFSEGFCVPGDKTAAFLEDALAQLGLTRAEANEFIIYWLPQMEQNAYNLISFQQETYTDAAKLTITPQPDTLLRVFMAWKPLTKAVEIAPQTLTAPERTGFTAVEWGGAKVQ